MMPILLSKASPHGLVVACFAAHTLAFVPATNADQETFGGRDQDDRDGACCDGSGAVQCAVLPPGPARSGGRSLPLRDESGVASRTSLPQVPEHLRGEEVSSRAA